MLQWLHPFATWGAKRPIGRGKRPIGPMAGMQRHATPAFVMRPPLAGAAYNPQLVVLYYTENKRRRGNLERS